MGRGDTHHGTYSWPAEPMSAAPSIALNKTGTAACEARRSRTKPTRPTTEDQTDHDEAERQALEELQHMRCNSRPFNAELASIDIRTCGIWGINVLPTTTHLMAITRRPYRTTEDQ